MNDEQFMQIALQEAEKSLEEGLLPVGAAVVQNGKVIAVGRKLNAHSYHLDHAEIIALREALKGIKYKRSDNLTLFTTLEPCVMCFGAILHCPINRVVYGASDVWGGGTSLVKSSSVPIRHNGKIPEIVGGVLNEESRELIKNFLLTITNDNFYNQDNLFVKSFLE